MAPGPSPYPESLEPSRRRLLGAYYTPLPIVDHLARVTLSPLLAAATEAARRGDPDEALRLKILDPACGDGAFLRAAGACIARALSAPLGWPDDELLRHVTRRCLFGLDIDPEAVSLARRAFRRDVGAAPSLLAADALGEAAPHPAGAFDAVIGNPPWGGWNRALTPGARRAYRGRFVVARGLLDPAMLFLERSIGWLRAGGRLGLVMPDYFLTKNYPAARGHLLERCHLEELTRWGQAFPGVNLEACSLVATRRPCAAATRSRAVVCLPRGPQGPALRVPVSAFRSAPGHVFNVSLDAAGRRLLRRLQSRGVPLSRLIEAHEGIHSGNIRARLFLPPGSRTSRTTRMDQSVPAGQGAPRPLLFGRHELRPFVTRPSGWQVVYDRRAIRKARGEYANLGRASWYAPPKLLIRRTGDRVVAAVDRAGLMASNNLFVARLRPGCPLPIESLCAWLNSPVATWCFRAMVPRAGSLFAELKLEHLARLPVPPPPATASGRRTLARLARLARQLEDPALDDACAERHRLRAEADAIVMGLSRLSRAEAAIIAPCAPVAP